MGGVAICVHLKSHTVKVTEREDNNKFAITKLSHINPSLNIVNIYGAIKSRTNTQEIIESWDRIKIELDKINDRIELCLLIGDFNRALGAGWFGIEGNKPNVSHGGKLVLELLESGEYKLGNSSDKVAGGP